MTEQSKSAHTPGKIAWNDNWLISDETQRFRPILYYTIDDDGLHGSDEDKERLAACWNACEGINPDAVADVVTMLKETCAILDGYATGDHPEFDEPADMASEFGNIHTEITMALAKLEQVSA